jgi:hypothetical protein
MMGTPGEDGLMGTPGKNGTPGEDGKDGEMGTPGNDGQQVRASTLCQSSVTNTSTGALVFGLGYSIVEYESGDVWTSCHVDVPAGSYSSSNYFDVSQTGATNQACSVGADDGAGTGGTASFGWWSFELASGGSRSAKYHDSDSINDGLVVTFSGADATHDGCTTLMR